MADRLRLGHPAVPPAAQAQELGDAILAGAEALELVDAIEYEIREDAAFRGVCNNDNATTAAAWDALREAVELDREAVHDIREALVATGSLSATDRDTNLAALITALFAT